MSAPQESGPAALRPRVVLTIGKLDGVHAGHRHLAAHVQARADEVGARSAAIVLHPDPVSVISSERVPRLTTVEERCTRLRAFGVEVVEPLRFTREIASLAPGVFLDHLEERFEIAGVVVGPDFAFGRGRRGDVSRLDALASERDFTVDIVSPIEAVGEWISSRRLRGLIHGGDISLARTLMRRPPRVVGTVIHGAARGRELGFPTANLDLTADFVLPANGIYAVRAEWRPHRRAPRTSADGVASVGVRPTFDNGARLVEVHLFDFYGDLYDKELTVDFLAFQRPEERFESVSELVSQMEQDAEIARSTHEAERRAGWGVDADAAGAAAGARQRARVRGRDLADLCQGAADAVAGAVEGRPGSRMTATLNSDDDRALLEDWLAFLGTPAGGAGQTTSHVVGASVYHAGAGRLHALLWLADAESDASAGDRAASLVRLGTADGGWLEADVELPVSAARRSPTYS